MKYMFHLAGVREAEPWCQPHGAGASGSNTAALAAAILAGRPAL